MDADRLLDGLNEAQRRAVTTSVVPLCILAGAGSGKTRVLTRRIAYRAATDQHDPNRVLALTFTRKAAGELTQRLRHLGLRDSVIAGTFHGVAYAQLRARWADRNIAPPALLDRKVGFVARLMPSSTRSSGRTTKDVLPLDVVSEIEWAKARRVTPDQYPSAAKAASRKIAMEPAQVAKVYRQYEEEKRARRMVDFDDLLSLCLRDLGRDALFAEAQRWRFRHFFVDEYQDVNPLQQALIEAWMGDRTDLCVVGDPQQAIYAWNGADARYLNGFTSTWQRGEVVRLADNYRSSPQILAVANAVLAGSLSSRRAAEAGEQPGALRPNRPDGPVPTIRAYPDDKAEAQGIARAVRDAHQPGASWRAQAILVRTNAQTSLLEAALRAARIPFRVKGGTSLLEQPEVKAALRDLRQQRDSFAGALTDLETLAARGLGGSGDGELGPDEWSRSTATAIVGAPSEPDADSRQANLDALVRLGHDYAALDPYASTSGFLAWLAETNRSDQPDAQGDAVDITTFHAAKGLEWPIVHVAGLEQGLVPIGHAGTPAELAEERRLFYVAVTRAQRQLACSWAETRMFGTRTSNRDRSPYLAQVDAACRAVARDEVPTDWSAYFAEQRAAADRDRAEVTPSPGGGRGRRANGSAPGTTNATTKATTKATTNRKPTGAPPAGAGVDQRQGALALDRPGGRRGAQAARARLSSGRVGGALSTFADDDLPLLEALKDWRRDAARAASVPSYVVFDDATLEAIATRRPATPAALQAVPGVGPVKIVRYGDSVLAVIAESPR